MKIWQCTTDDPSPNLFFLNNEGLPGSGDQQADSQTVLF